MIFFIVNEVKTYFNVELQSALICSAPALLRSGASLLQRIRLAEFLNLSSSQKVICGLSANIYNKYAFYMTDR